MKTNLEDILQTCLEEMEKGASVETLLARYAEFSSELRPLLKTAQAAKLRGAANPSAAAHQRGRARLLQHTENLRARRSAPRRTWTAAFQKFSFALAAALFFFITSSGLIRGSASALPGETLYPIKRGWEGMQTAFTFDGQKRIALAETNNRQRIDETKTLLAQGKRAQVEFSGVLSGANQTGWTVADVPVLFPAAAQIPAAGESISVTGWTSSGAVEIEEFHLILTVHQTPVPTPRIFPTETLPAPTPSVEQRPAPQRNELTPSSSEQKDSATPAPKDDDDNSDDVETEDD